MRKNLLIVALVGFCVMGLAACQKGENKANDTTTTTAMTQEQPAAPEQTADASTANQAAPIQPEANQQQAAADANQAAPVADQANPSIASADSNNAAPAMDSNAAPTDSNNQTSN